MSDLISVIIPVYNVESYLEKCIQSVIIQTYQNMEIILVDDGSTDRSGAICDEYALNDDRIIVIHQKNSGQSVARNIGLDICRGQYIVFVDSDDSVEPFYVEYLYRLILDNNAEISGCEYKFVSPEGKILNRYENNRNIIVMDQKEALQELCSEKLYSSSLCAKMYSRVVFKNIRFPEGHIFEDMATVYRLFMNASKIVFGQCVQYNYLKRPGSTMTSEFTVQRLDAIIFVEKMCGDIVKMYPDLYYIAQKRLFIEYTYMLRSISLTPKIIPGTEELVRYLFKKVKETRLATWKNQPNRRQRLYVICSLFGRRALQIIFYLEAVVSRK